MKKKVILLVAALLSLIGALCTIPAFADGPEIPDPSPMVECRCKKLVTSPCSARNNGNLCAAGYNIQCDQYDGNCR